MMGIKTSETIQPSHLADALQYWLKGMLAG